jgi:hypothetical protein
VRSRSRRAVVTGWRCRADEIRDVKEQVMVVPDANVGQTFLHHAKDRRLHIFRQAAKVRRHFDLDPYSASLGETIDVPGKRGLQPQFIEFTRVAGKKSCEPLAGTGPPG